jgi:hypothetical protein
VVIVTWDDWGGFYDDVLPWNCTSAGNCSGYPGQPQSADYVYGFRVPLLVVGAYTNQICTYSIPPMCRGYISGTTGQGGEIQRYVHEFGSILNFIEYAFGTGGNPLGGEGGIGGIIIVIPMQTGSHLMGPMRAVTLTCVRTVFPTSSASGKRRTPSASFQEQGTRQAISIPRILGCTSPPILRTQTTT